MKSLLSCLCLVLAVAVGPSRSKGPVKNINPLLDPIIDLMRLQFKYLPLPEITIHFTAHSSPGTINLKDGKFGKMTTVSRVGDALLTPEGNNRYTIVTKYKIADFVTSFKEAEYKHFGLEESASVKVSCKDMSATLGAEIIDDGRGNCAVKIETTTIDGSLSECRVNIRSPFRNNELYSDNIQQALAKHGEILKDRINHQLGAVLDKGSTKAKQLLCALVKDHP